MGGLTLITETSPTSTNRVASVPDTAAPPTIANATKVILPDSRYRLMDSLRDEIVAQDRMASIIARKNKKCIYINYSTVTVDDASQGFLRQRGEAGIKDLVEAGFEKVSIEAKTENGNTSSREIVLSEYLTELKMKKEKAR